ncbi:hypothetical protein [Devosia sediminis]|uniref:DUF3311 domain-containing protein n=1 Tax=Devosia sediminis TaxID=2798801 RepID=A0A934MGS1_9HYPH|nr:hypothetical protein [Devosia sediminis]MBJ3784247.1 hypothetical protein [Devosia sediminis]
MADRRRVVGGMLVLTVAGFLLLVPPLVQLFNHPVMFLGVPQIVVYLFGVWLALILGTVALTRHLQADQIDPAEDGDT